MKPNEKVGDTSAGEQYSIVFKNRVPDFNECTFDKSTMCPRVFFFCQVLGQVISQSKTLIANSLIGK